jgi:predicted enzyme related to lactoylglutathione lyase
MTETITSLTNRPAWVDLATSDAEGARDFYSRLFGWQVEVNDDPQYGGYAIAKLGQGQVGGIGPKQNEQQPTTWSLYIGTDDIDSLADRVERAGGTILVPPTDVGDQGRFAVFQDPSGGAVSAWQAATMRDFRAEQPNTFGWAELNARGVERAIPFYEELFGWSHRTSESTPDQPPYTEFLIDGQSIAGAWEMSPMVPANVPSYWQIYFNVDDVDAAFRKALELGAREMLPPQDFPGGRFAIVSDPQGASFGLLKTTNPS